MKPEAKKQAIELRKKGYSYKEISKMLEVSKSTVGVWVKDVILSDDQISKLNTRSTVGLAIASKQMSENYRLKRLESEMEGRAIAKKLEWLHIAGCMLYWGEGTKNKNRVTITNADLPMLTFFLKFINTYFVVKREEFKIRINCHTDNGYTAEEIEDFWLKELGFERSNLQKTTVKQGNLSKKRLKFGVCAITLCRTDIVQHIFGAIQEYSGTTNADWTNIQDSENR